MAEEETGAERETRRLRLVPMPAWLQGYTLTIFAILAVIWIYSHPNDKGDSQWVGPAILGFASAIILAIYPRAAIKDAKQILLNQNQDLAEIKGKVNGNVERLLAEQTAKHFAELQAAEAKAKEERHKRDGVISNLQLELESVKTELKLIQKGQP